MTTGVTHYDPEIGEMVWVPSRFTYRLPGTSKDPGPKNRLVVGIDNTTSEVILDCGGRPPKTLVFRDYESCEKAMAIT